jgi:hypothetical protein
LGSPETNQLGNFMNKSANNKIIFLKEEHADVQGSFTYPDGSKYVGEFKDGESVVEERPFYMIV